jgi:hypothetical protein
MSPALENATAKVRATADALARAYNYEDELKDLRAAIKADAIKRVMKRDGLAATVAEKIVETDAEYFAHREKQRESVVLRFKADAEYWAAKVEATQASLITPDVFALTEEIDELTISVLNANDRVTEYAATVKLLKDQLALANEAIAHLQSELENSVETIP